MSVHEAVKQVLNEAGEPLHYQQITRRMLDNGLWTTQGKTPEATVNAYLATDIKQHGSSSLFQRTAKGVFALRALGLPEYIEQASDVLEDNIAAQGSETNTSSQNSQLLSFTDAAEYVLKHFSSKKPLHYRDITKKALELGIIKTAGQTPDATMYAQILTEIARQERRGEMPRFVKLGKGQVALAQWQGEEQPPELIELIERHNQQVRKELHERLHKMHPTEFEELVGELLAALGFEDVAVTEPSGDGGIDVRGTLVIGEVVHLRMAVQVKRWKYNVQSPIVQQVRGSLGIHEQGLIITTGGFSKGAIDEAAQGNKVPVSLMNGEQLVSLLIEHNIGVQRASYSLLELNTHLSTSTEPAIT